MIKKKKNGDYEIKIEDVEFKSVNDLSNLHWKKRKTYKDYLRIVIDLATNYKRLKSGFNLEFYFYFGKSNRKYDTINVSAMAKIIEDCMFVQDDKNGYILLNTEKTKNENNSIIIKLKKIEDKTVEKIVKKKKAVVKKNKHKKITNKK